MGYLSSKSPEYQAWAKGDNQRDEDYPRYLWYFLATGFALLFAARLVQALERYLAKPNGKDSRVKSFIAKARNGYNKYIGYIKISNPFFSFHLGDLLLLATYFIVSITFSFNETPDSPPPIHYGYANRSGMMTFASIPFIVALAGRNNFISFLLGIPYERLRVYHFWCSRMTLLTTLIHAIGRLKISTVMTWTSTTNRWGLTGFIAGCLIFLGSFSFIMKSRYEIFYVFHLVMVIIYIVGSWYHQPENREWLYAAIAVWALDRVFRVLRIVAFNGLLRFKGHSSEVKVTKVSEDTVRLEVVRPDFPSWKAGSHAFISSIGLHWFPQGHPFTIASIPTSLADIESKSEAASSIEKMSTSSESSVNFQANPTLVFIVRARDGWTKHLLRFAEIQEKNQRLRLLVDGPYSPPSPIDHFEKVILFAGGSGVSWTLPLLLDLVSKSKSESKSKVKKLVWVWIIRDSNHLSWIGKDLLSVLTLLGSSSNLQVDLKIFTTNHRRSTDTEKEVNSFDLDSQKDLLSPLESFNSFSLNYGRPDVSKLLEGSISNSQERRIFVGSSGPSQMSDALRETSRKLMRSGSKEGQSLDLTFKAEEFGW